MTFENLGKHTTYKKYDNGESTRKRNVNFEIDVAEELNKISAVLRKRTGIQVNTSVLVDIGMRYFFQYLDDIGEADAMNLLVNGTILKIKYENLIES